MRYISIYKAFLKQYLKTLMEYKADFLIGMMSFLLVQSSNIIFMSLIFARIPDLNGWTYYEVLFIYGFSQLPRGLDHLFTDNLWLVSNSYVRTGEFDKYLLRPINPLFHIISERFQPDAFGEIVVGVVITTFAYINLGLHFTMIQWLLFIVAVMTGTVIYTTIKLLGASLALWTKRSRHFLSIIYSLADFASYPLSIFSTIIKVVLTFIIPFAFVAFIPASVLLGRAEFDHAILIGAAVAAILWCIAYYGVWKRGLKSYESVGN